MTTRPTTRWRKEFHEEQAGLAAGTLPEDEAYAIHLWPIEFTEAADAALATYELEVRGWENPGDDEVFAAIERVVKALNDIDGEHGRIETDERDELCEFISAVLTDAGIDPRSLAQRRGIGVHELTDDWRDW